MRVIYASLLAVFVILAVNIVSASAQSYADKRCRCVCSNPAAALNTTGIDLQVFTGNTSQRMCSCPEFILKKLGDYIKVNGPVFCLRCECIYQVRNTNTIMVVVFIIIIALIFLAGYMSFLICLQPLINQDRVKPYRHVMRHNRAEARRLLLHGDDVEDF